MTDKEKQMSFWDRKAHIIEVWSDDLQEKLSLRFWLGTFTGFFGAVILYGFIKYFAVN